MNEQNTALWERRLGDGLNALMDVDPPVPTVTVADVIASGREARRRRRRAAFAVSAALVVVVTALSFGAVLAARRDGSLAPPGYGGPTMPVGTETDPAAPDVSFGWLPADMRGEEDISLDPGGPDVMVWNVLGGSYLQVTVNSPGAGFEPGPSAGTVQGHQAWWSMIPGSGTGNGVAQLSLTWRYAPRSWATIYYYNGTSDAAAATMMLKVANKLVIGPLQAQAMPFRIPKMPAHMHADGVRTYLDQWQNAHFGDAALRLCVTSPCDSGGLIVSQQSSTPLNAALTAQAFGDTRVDLFTDELRPGTDLPTNLTAAVDGQQAKLWANGSSATLVFSDGGSSVMVSAAGAEYRAIGRESGLLAFARSLTWFGGNPARWTMDVIG